MCSGLCDFIPCRTMQVAHLLSQAPFSSFFLAPVEIVGNLF